MIDTSLRPIPDRRFDFEHAQHLLIRAGFGGTPGQVAALQRMGLDRAVDLLVDYDRVDTSMLQDASIDPDVIRPPTAKERREQRMARKKKDEAAIGKFRALRNQAKARDRGQLADLQQWWLTRMIVTPRPLEEKLTLLWHGHFATGYRSVEDAYLMFVQNEMFRTHASGNFARLAHGIIRDPAMLIYLNNNRNIKHRPNENLARELMELFTLGEGHYTEADIKEGARALTGYHVHDNAFVLNKRQHDRDGKKILGRQGNHDGEDFVNILLTHPACAEFVAYKLYRCFVTDVDRDALPDHSEKVIRSLAMELRRSKYAMKPVLKTLFKSRHFYDDGIRAAKIKSPIELIVQQIRTLRTPARDVAKLHDASRMMGMELFQPPNVAGWPGGRAWINTSTLFVRQNISTYLLTGKAPYGDWDRSHIDYDATRLIADLPDQSAPKVAEFLVNICLGSAASKQRVDEIRTFARRHDDKITNDSLVAMLSLITAMPEYQLC